MPRHLEIAPEILPSLEGPMLAQLESVVDDPDNLCCVCGQPIDGPTAEVVLFVDGEVGSVKLADSGCMQSAICELPGLRQGLQAVVADGIEMLTLLTCREAEPRALLFLQPRMVFADPGEDPLERYARTLGLAPISGSIEDIEAPETDAFTIEPIEGGLALRLATNTDLVEATDDQLRAWLAPAEGQALVIVARGLGLARAEPTIEEALMLRPAWGAVATVST
jgi:hypothetical protein